jgi:hypothetical protein
LAVQPAASHAEAAFFAFVDEFVEMAAVFAARKIDIALDYPTRVFEEIGQKARDCARLAGSCRHVGPTQPDRPN